MRRSVKRPVGFFKSDDATRLKKIVREHHEGIEHLNAMARDVDHIAEKAIGFMTHEPPEQNLSGLSGWYDDFQVSLGNVVGPVIDGAGNVIGNAYEGVTTMTSENVIDAVNDVAIMATPLGTTGIFVVNKTGQVIGEVKDAVGTAYDRAGTAIGKLADNAGNAVSSATKLLMWGAIAIGLIVFLPEIKAITHQFHRGHHGD